MDGYFIDFYGLFLDFGLSEVICPVQARSDEILESQTDPPILFM